MDSKIPQPTAQQDNTETPPSETGSGQPDTKEIIYLASGLLALVLGLGGLMMYSEEEPLPATAFQGNETVRITRSADMASAFIPPDSRPADSESRASSQAQAKEPMTNPVTSPITEPSDNPLLNGTEVYFAFNEWTLSEEAKEVLKTRIENKPEGWTGRLHIVGYTDAQGSDAYNRALGHKRAQAVKAYVVSLGIPESDVQMESLGKDAQTCEGTTQSCFEQNRRAHVAFLPSSTPEGDDLQLSMTSDPSNPSTGEEPVHSIDTPQTLPSETEASLQEEIKDEPIKAEPLIGEESLP